MSRSWLAFGVGLLVLASPLHAVWSSGRDSLAPAFVVAAGLVGLGVWVSRART
jgi:hypothetical protein